MTAITFTEAYTDQPRTPRERLEHEVKRLMMMHWADSGDAELRERVTEAEAVLRAFDAKESAT